MQKSVTEKILENHLILEEHSAGQEVAIRIDQTLTQDATGTMTYLQLEALGTDRVKTELSVSYIDHNTVQIGPENADDHRYLKTVAAKYGIVFSPAGNGICHQVHLERFAKPGKTLLGSDSHTCTSGAIGMIAIGTGGLDVAVAMAGGPFFFPFPNVVRLNLIGHLNPWVSAKDAILTVLENFGTQGNVGCIFEYGGKGVKTLSVPERATIANMGAECGVTTTVFPSDERTKEFLSAQGREEDWIPIEADEGTEYARVVEIDLGEIVPKVACPHSPGNVRNVQDLLSLKVDQVCIGSCTNSSYKDFFVVGEILRDKRIHPDVSLVVAPGSRQVLQMIANDSILGILIGSGARIQESACGFCVGNSQSPQTNGVSLRTNNRNFLGRSGTKTSEVYLCSPETAAASAVLGVLTDPRDQGIPYPNLKTPRKFVTCDEFFLKPTERPADVEIYRGPHMGEVPLNSPLPKNIRGSVSIKLGDKVTTDHIIPAGNKMKFRSNVSKYAEYVFEVLDESFARRASKIRDSGRFNVIVAGLSYGQGSSREHAALCPMYLGVRAVLAKSFERIHGNNLVNFGILPLIFLDESDYDWLDKDDELEVKDIRSVLRHDQEISIYNKTKGRYLKTAFSLSDREKEIVIAGGKLLYLKAST